MSSPAPGPAAGNPPPLTTAASLAAVEGAVVAMLAVAELFSLTGGRLTMGLTTAVFFAAYGIGLIACAWGVTRRAPWARSPLLLTQLIQLGLAWNLRDSPTTVVAVVIAVVALIVLAGLLHPSSTAALEGGRSSAGGETER